MQPFIAKKSNGERVLVIDLIQKRDKYIFFVSDLDDGKRFKFYEIEDLEFYHFLGD